VILRCPS
jgi:uncharacterized protein